MLMFLDYNSQRSPWYDCVELNLPRKY